jgi:hypothetical protein
MEGRGDWSPVPSRQRKAKESKAQCSRQETQSISRRSGLPLQSLVQSNRPLLHSPPKIRALVNKTNRLGKRARRGRGVRPTRVGLVLPCMLAARACTSADPLTLSDKLSFPSWLGIASHRIPSYSAALDYQFCADCQTCQPSASRLPIRRPRCRTTTTFTRSSNPSGARPTMQISSRRPRFTGRATMASCSSIAS